MYPTEYTIIKNEIQATRLAIMTDNGSARTPAFRFRIGIQFTWLCTPLPENASGISVVAETALARARPTAV
jgi:hypothetical protein